MISKLNKLFLILIIIIFFANTTAIAEESSKKNMFVRPGDIAVEHAIDSARQNMYKSFITLITGENVNDPSVLPAATLSKIVFEEMSKKGWHEARLLSVDEFPNNPDNSPKDEFEKEATEALVSGKNYYEKVEITDGKYYLRVATSVSAVMDGCTICHPGKRDGDLLGAISYKISLNKYFRD